MDNRRNADSPQRIKVLEQLRKERSAAIEGLTTGKLKNKATCQSPTQGAANHSIPQVLINSVYLKEEGLSGNNSSPIDASNEGKRNEDADTLENLDRSDSQQGNLLFDNVNSSIETNAAATKYSSRRGSNSSLLDVPVSHRSVSSEFVNLQDLNSKASVGRTLRHVSGEDLRSRSPSLSRNDSLDSQTGGISLRKSPISSPDVSPMLPRRKLSSGHISPECGKARRGPPTNTEDRLRARSAHLKLQKFLDDSKSNFTTAQTLELYAEATTIKEAQS